MELQKYLVRYNYVTFNCDEVQGLPSFCKLHHAGRKLHHYFALLSVAFSSVVYEDVKLSYSESDHSSVEASVAWSDQGVQDHSL